MPNDIDKSILDRLQALRGPSPATTPERAAPVKFNVDPIERTKPATREDTLAARLKSLRAQDEASPSSKVERTTPQSTPSKSLATPSSIIGITSGPEPLELNDGDDVDAMFQTDDQTLQELLGDVGPEETPAEEPSDEKVKALLEEISRSIPRDDEPGEEQPEDDKKAKDSDDSDGEHMQDEVDEVIAKFRDEMELEAALGKDEEEQSENDEPHNQNAEDTPPNPDLALPSLPSNLDDLPSAPVPRATSADIDDITARMAALRSPGTTTTQDGSLDLPSVPSSRPSGKPVNRLSSKTNYTDDDMDGWCTVCLEDATLQCLGCDDDVYCTRCWKEMHIGPSAGFDERSHKAVHFTKAKKKEKKVALGA
ncbi:hypothetical protein PT974_05867 [Cladobotryum mycophilum]|uniref:Uncharacterized protein n=1 Tax=Cladobotryum mycophilum TaxID=491253 RepID=A0ABR0SKQ0_9HYPO